jgi:hypothetical protein
MNQFLQEFLKKLADEGIKDFALRVERVGLREALKEYKEEIEDLGYDILDVYESLKDSFQEWLKKKSSPSGIEIYCEKKYRSPMQTVECVVRSTNFSATKQLSWYEPTFIQLEPKIEYYILIRTRGRLWGKYNEVGAGFTVMSGETKSITYAPPLSTLGGASIRDSEGKVINKGSPKDTVFGVIVSIIGFLLLSAYLRGCLLN